MTREQNEPEEEAIAVVEVIDPEEGMSAVAYLNEQLLNRGSKDSRRDAWQRLVQLFLGMERGEAVRWLSAFLESGMDGETGFVFEVGPGGRMLTASTWRVFALDLLGRLDSVAAFYLAAKGLEGEKASADEYALHLRNYAWGAQAMDSELSGVKSYLLEKTTEGLGVADWLEDPTDGFSEMYDVLVWADGVGMVERLSELAGAELRAISKPAVMVLDRLMISEPLEVLEPLIQSGRWSGTGAQRAELVGRADLLDGKQVALVQYYFQSLADGVERERYLNSVPNLDFVLSHNLLSEHRFFLYETVLSRLKGAQAMLMDWGADDHFVPWKGPIDERLKWINGQLEQVQKKATTLP